MSETQHVSGPAESASSKPPQVRDAGQGGGVAAHSPPWLRQFAKFCLVGILNGAVDAGLYFVLTRWLGLGSYKIAAKAISYTAAIINSFFLNRAWTFQSERKTASAFVPFAVSNLLSLGINAGVMHLALQTWQLPDTIAVFVAMTASFFWNFTTSKFLVFRK